MIDKYIDIPPTNGIDPWWSFLSLGKSTKLKKIEKNEDIKINTKVNIKTNK